MTRGMAESLRVAMAAAIEIELAATLYDLSQRDCGGCVEGA